MTENTEKKRTLWDYPWGYGESFIIAGELLIFGFIIEFLTGGAGISSISMPYNFYILALFAGILISLHIFKRHHPVVKWLSGVPAAISSIVLFGVITLLMGFIPQKETHPTEFLDLIGLTHLKSGWPILFAQMYLLTTLGLVCMKRIFPFSWKNFGFMLNHFGLWITLVAAMLGSGDLKRLTLNLLEDGKANNLAMSRTGEAYKLPFELKLLDFHIDEYVPRLVLVDPHSGRFIMEKDDKAIMIEPGKTYAIKNWDITIEKYLEDAVPSDSIVSAKTTPGSFPAAFVRIRDKKSGQENSGWLGTGSFAYNPMYLYLTEDVILALTMPEAKKYRSKVVVSENNEVKDTVSIIVNKPYKINSWLVYQISYDENKGKWSTLSVLEVVSDPWLKIVYLGIFLMLGGSVFLFWNGRKRLN